MPLDEIDEDAKRVRSKRRSALRWIGAGVGVMLAGGFVAVLRRHFAGNDGELPFLFRAAPPVIVFGALLAAWGVIGWVRIR